MSALLNLSLKQNRLSCYNVELMINFFICTPLLGNYLLDNGKLMNNHLNGP